MNTVISHNPQYIFLQGEEKIKKESIKIFQAKDKVITLTELFRKRVEDQIFDSKY
jgi:hypothetical protein